MGGRDGLPMFTITSLQDLEPTAPSAPYLRTMLDGLGEAFGWAPNSGCTTYCVRPASRRRGMSADSSSYARASPAESTQN
jgi:hypothetical protein